MKSTIKNTGLLAILLCLTTFFSCEKESNETQFDFETFKSDLQDDQDYQDYIAAQSIFLGHLGRGDMDILGITTTLQDHDVEDFCSFDQGIIEGLKGARKFSDSYCSVKSNLIKLLKSKNSFSKLSETQIYNILIIPSSTVQGENNQAENRADCLEAYSFAYVYNLLTSCPINYNDDPHVDDLCHDQNVAAGAVAYDNCCANGGTQCS